MHKNNSIHVPFAIDLLCLSFLAILITLAGIYSDTIVESPDIMFRLSIALLAHALLAWCIVFVVEGYLRAVLRIASLAVLFFFLFDQMQHFQHIFFDSWLDSQIVNAESHLLGTQLVVFLQRFIHPIITEGMMFAYVAYYPMLLGFAFLCYTWAGRHALNDYLLNLLLTLVACYVGFIVLPIAGPLNFDAASYTIPLEGGLFAWCGEWIRNNQHYPGGSLPSAHCAAATTMLIMLHRYNKATFYLILPTVMLLVAATFYGRYHYVWDSVAGILTAFAVVRLSPAFVSFAGSLQRTLATLLHETPERQETLTSP